MLLETMNILMQLVLAGVTDILYQLVKVIIIGEQVKEERMQAVIIHILFLHPVVSPQMSPVVVRLTMLPPRIMHLLTL